MKASELTNMSMIRTALAGIPASGAEHINDVSFTGGTSLGFDCGVPADPYAKDLGNGGKHVLIGDINRILLLVGTGIYLRQRGGTNEFDERVVAIDKGAKSDSGHWGYPNGAIIDWWNEGTFKKVICIKSGEREENGNCTVGPDDPTNGVEGTGTRYWQLVEKPSQATFLSYSVCPITDVAHLDNGTYVLDKFAKVRLTWRASITHRDFTGQTFPCDMIFYLRPNDTMKIASLSVTINSMTFSAGTSSISSNGNVTGMSLVMEIYKCVWSGGQ